MEKDRLEACAREIMLIMNVRCKRMNDERASQLKDIMSKIESIIEEEKASQPLEFYVRQIHELLEKSGKKVAKSAPTVTGVAIAWLNVDRLSKKISEMSVDEYTTEEVTKGSLKHVPIPEFRILKEQQDALNRGAKTLGLNLDEGVLTNDIDEEDPLIAMTKKVMEAANTSEN